MTSTERDANETVLAVVAHVCNAMSGRTMHEGTGLDNVVEQQDNGYLCLLFFG